MVDFAQALARGNARVEYIFHVAGMPWAVGTSQTIVDKMSPGYGAYRRLIFGNETYNGAATYFANEVDIYPYLQVPGAQTIKVEDGFGEFDSGTWTAQIADLPVKPSWNHGTRNIWGLEGIQAIANPRVDNSIKAAKVSSLMAKADTTLDVTDDIGNQIYTAVNAASDAAPFVAWAGGECLAFISAVDHTSYSTLTTTAALRGLLNSKSCYHAPNRSGAAGAPSEVLCEFPLNGIIGRPYYLWAFVLDDAEDIISGPVKFRHGKVGTDVKFDGTFWNIQCLPWWKWIDTEIDTRVVKARMDDYVLSRPMQDGTWGPKALEAEPHLRFREYDYATTTWTDWLNVWLCAEGATVHYTSCKDLEDALVAEMNVVSAASGNGWTYTWTLFGPITYDLAIDPAHVEPPTASSQDWFFISGHLPFMLMWGLGIGSNGAQHQDFRKHQAQNEWVPWWIGGDYRYENSMKSHDVLVSHVDLLILSYSYYMVNEIPYYTPKGFGTRPKYILQWWYQIDTLPDEAMSGGWLFPQRCFPIPETVIEGTGTPAIWIDPDFDITSMVASSVVQMGAEDIYIGGSEDWAGISTLSNFLEASCGTGTATTNYIVAAVLPPDTGTPCVVATPSYEETSPKKIFYPGQMLFYSRYCHKRDPWPIIQSFDVVGDSLGDIYQAIFGETVVGCTVAEEIQTDFIPDHDTIDWTLLDEFTTPEACPFASSILYKLRYTGVINLWKILLEELKFYGINPTWEWSNSLDQYQMKFRRAGTINATMAALNGHRINEHTIVAGSKITAETADTWQLNSIDLSMNWNPMAEKFSAHFKVLDHSGYAPTGGKINTLEIAPQITQIPDLLTNSVTQASVIAWFSNHLDNMMYPRPSQSVSATLYQVMQMGVGTDVQVTCDNVHNPFTGEVGITDHPCIINEMTIDPSKGTAKYNYLMASKLEYGWAPSCLVTGSTWVAGTHTATVTTIGGNGVAYCGTGITSGWFDHWFFADYAYNGSMSEPETLSSTLFYATAVEYGSATPAVITGIQVATVSKLNYTDALAAGNFMTLVDVTDAWDTGKDYYLIFEAHNSAVIAEAQKKYVFIAGDDLELDNSDATHELTREWT